MFRISHPSGFALAKEIQFVLHCSKRKAEGDVQFLRLMSNPMMVHYSEQFQGRAVIICFTIYLTKIVSFGADVPTKENSWTGLSCLVRN